MRPGPLIVLLGISGVGKSFLARRMSEFRPDLLCLSAGTLLKEALRVDPEKLRTANRDVILANQALLSEAVRRARSGRWQQTVLLEAHSVIDNDKDLIDVPVEIIQALEIAGIILIEEYAAHIRRRRKADLRTRPDRKLYELDEQQRQSSEVAVRYATILSVPILRLSSEDYNSALNFVQELEYLSQPD